MVKMEAETWLIFGSAILGGVVAYSLRKINKIDTRKLKKKYKILFILIDCFTVLITIGGCYVGYWMYRTWLGWDAIVSTVASIVVGAIGAGHAIYTSKKIKEDAWKRIRIKR
jgi:predicted small integral membrane protein